MSIIDSLGWAMATQFQPLRSGYVYRQDRTGRPILVTAGERRGFVRAFGWNFPAHVAGFMATVIMAAMVTAHLYPKGNETGGFVLMGGLLAIIGFGLYASVKWAMHAPSRVLSDRPTLSNGAGS
ncbi:hypothetical protein KQ910_07275 [Reyranella sp. MMS21-HV4-11]|uniref:Uncharacterized protein n=1 Tax=Reyranella humidisoli TaxID=2849149 RepID=A0ABS6IJW6_9HYPH|nr:hypothetical protein [Reyranella sp. MMS21-HV4-11]MBU8873558.1 hypothetical protein [Reyranella sp. MMS21-HV4-11]